MESDRANEQAVAYLVQATIIRFTNDIFFYTNYCHLAECINTKQCALSSRSILLQSLKNTKFHRYLHMSYKHSKCVYVFATYCI
jgi:hypothetical protein